MHSVIRFLVCVCCALIVCPSSALAQGEDSEWAAGSGGHFAFLAQDKGNVPSLRMVGLDGAVSAPEVVAEAYADPIVAVGPRGDAIVVWIGESDDALHARYRPGGALGPTELVALQADFDAETVTAGLDAAGNATVTWSPERDEERGGLWVRTRSEAGVWSDPQSLGGYRVFASSLAVAANGSALLAWRQSKTSKHPNLNQVAISARAPGGASFSRARVLAGVNHDPGEPTVAANDRGDAIVVWSQLEGRETSSRSGVGARARHPVRPPGAAQPRARHGGRWVTVLADGAMVMGWTNNLNRHVEARVRSAAGKLGPPVVLTHDLEVNSDLFPLANGALAWADRDPGVSRIKLALVDGLGFRPPIDVVRVHGWFLGPAFSVGPAGVSIVPRPPLHADDPIRWQPVPLAVAAAASGSHASARSTAGSAR